MLTTTNQEMEAEETNDMIMMSNTQGFKGFPTRDQEITTTNPWQVDSVQEFACLKCPECTFDTKKGEVFKDHAVENHPLSFVLFVKTLKEEEEFDPSLLANQFNLDSTGIKKEVTEGNNEKSSRDKNSHKCSTCNATFLKRYNLKRHIEQVHEDKRPYECTECDKKFKKRDHLKSHFSRAHGDKDYVQSEIKQEYIEDSYQETDYLINQNVADYCEPNLEEMNYEYIDYNTTRNENYQKSKKKKPKIPGSKSDPEIRKKYTPIIHEGNKQFECNECKKTYATAYGVSIHISSEHEGNRPMCTVCGKTFCLKKALQNHMNEVHEKKIVARCDKCDKGFTQKNALKRHIDSVHEGKRPHLCTICGSSFAENKKLQLHIAAVHKKEKPFSCHLCGIRFARKDKLNVHIQAVHEGIKPKPRRPKSEGHVSNSGHLIENPSGHHQLDI